MTTGEAPIRILLVDDHPVVRGGLRALLSSDAGMCVVGEANDGDEGVEMALRFDPDVILMDLQMPRLGGIGATRRIKLVRPNAKVVVLSTFETEADVTEAISAGALGYLLKDSPPWRILEGIRAAAAGRSLLSPEVATRLMSRARGDSSALTRREIQILEHVARGATNAEVGKALRISEATVKTHLLHVFEKLNVPDRTAAVTVALERKLLRLI